MFYNYSSFLQRFVESLLQEIKYIIKKNENDIYTTTLTYTAKLTSCSSAEDVNIMLNGRKEKVNM